MSQIILLGDSIFDNASYVPAGLSVIEQLREAIPKDWRASLLAEDGSVVSDLAGQLQGLPSDATHLIISVGGNNALAHIDVIKHRSAGSFADVMSRLAQICAEFQNQYRAMLEIGASLGAKIVVCTVYDAIPGLTPAERTGLILFNEVILREAFRAMIPVIDLRLICTGASDYSTTSPIEPSVSGGAKIVQAIICAVANGSRLKSGSWIIA